jgi:fatty acid CoA ligase FadD9
MEVDVTALSEARSLGTLVRRAFRLYAPRPLIGFKVDSRNSFRWQSYAQVLRDVDALSGALVDRRRCFVVSTLASCYAFYVLQWACWIRQDRSDSGTRRRLVPVPAHHSASLDYVRHVVDKCGRANAILVASRHNCARYAALLDDDGDSLDIVVVDRDDDVADAYHCDETASLRAAIDRVAIRFDDLLRRQSTRAADDVAVVDDDSDDNGLESIAMLLPTSGSSGRAKLTIVSEAMLLRQGAPPRVGARVVMLAHEQLRQSVDLLSKGGSVGVSCPARLRADLPLVRPTVFGAVPSVWESLRDEYALLSSDDERDRWRPLGNRCRIAVIGGAASSAALRHFIFDRLRCGAVLNGYGASEVGSLTANDHVLDSVELHLVDCAELGFLTSDEPPRGEIVAWSPRVTPGYFKDDEATRQSFVTIGTRRFFRTNDIGERQPDGSIRVIDRRSALVKLRQGIFVAPSPLEAFYAQSPLVKHILVFGHVSASAVVAAVVPGAAAMTADDVLGDLRRLAKSNSSIKPWEVPAAVHVDDASAEWGVDNDLLVSIGKLNRRALLARYRDTLMLLVESFSGEPLEASSSSPSNRRVAAHVDDDELLQSALRAAIRDTMPHAGSARALRATDRLSSLGYDSLRLAQLAALLRKRFGTSLTVPRLAKLRSLATLQAHVFGDADEVAKHAHFGADEAARYFGAEIDNAWQSITWQAGSEAPTSSSAPMLLTGATGFLGIFLLRALLSSAQACTIRCLVRETPTVSASERLHESAQFYGIEALVDWSRVVAVAGSLDNVADDGVRPHLIVHNAARVNSVLGYEDLRHANVDGTARVIELCASSGAHLLHVSTVGLLSGSGALSERPVGVAEHGALHRLSGYAQSKFVAEQLVLRAARQGRLRGGVSIVRPGTISGDSELGSCNVSDAIVRLFAAMAIERMVTSAPPLPDVYPMTSVDFVASVCATAVSQLLRASSPNSNDVDIFHAVASHPMRLADMRDALNEVTAGQSERVSPQRFAERVASIDDERHPLFVFKEILLGSGFASIDIASLPSDVNMRSTLNIGAPPAVTASQFARQLKFAIEHINK